MQKVKLAIFIGIPLTVGILGWKIMTFGHDFRVGMDAGELALKKGTWEFLKREGDPFASAEVIEKFGLKVRWVSNNQSDSAEKWVGGYNSVMMEALKKKMGPYYFKDAEQAILHPTKK